MCSQSVNSVMSISLGIKMLATNCDQLLINKGQMEEDTSEEVLWKITANQGALLILPPRQTVSPPQSPLSPTDPRPGQS